MKLEMIIYV